MIEVDGLVFAYPGTKEPAVNDLEFSVGDGEIFGFLGSSAVVNRRPWINARPRSVRSA